MLICDTWKEIAIFKFENFRPVARLGEIDSTPTVPYWWYSPKDSVIPTWPLPATLAPSDALHQPSSFIGSILLTSHTRYVFRLYIRNGEPVLHRIPFEHYGDFYEFGCSSGFRVLRGCISSLRITNASAIPTDPVPLDITPFISKHFTTCHFDEFSARMHFIRCERDRSCIALLDLVE